MNRWIFFFYSSVRRKAHSTHNATMTMTTSTSDLNQRLLAAPYADDEACEASGVQKHELQEDVVLVARRRRNVFLFLNAWTFASVFLMVTCTTTSLGKKHFPNPFKHIKHGRVDYLMEYNAAGAPVYHRDITGPCDYGILTFKVAPASKSMPYSFDVYDDKFVFHDDLCTPIKPSRTISDVSDHAFLLPGDPTLVTAKFNYLTRMSSLVINPPNTKQINADAVAAYAGDYVVVARGDFYDAAVYRQVMDIVHNWNEENANVVSLLLDPPELFLKEE
jgi:hypothetical protein